MQSILFYGKFYTKNLNSEKGLRGYKCAFKSNIHIDMGKENKFTIVKKHLNAILIKLFLLLLKNLKHV